MRLGTRLLLPLLPTATVIMVVYAGWALIERENTVTPKARQEVQAYATALGLAFDFALWDVRRENVQALLNEVSRAPTVYGILIYDSVGARTIVSDVVATSGAAPESVLGQVLQTGTPATFEREIDEQRVYSVLRPLHGPGGRVIGALEVAQPLSSVDAEKARVRRRFALNTVTLLAAISIVMLLLVQRVVARPMERLVAAARAVGGGDLTYRIPEAPAGGELAELAREFNGMAGNLELARAAVARQVEERLALERRLHGAEKMAEIGKLAAGLAHEIAAPLNVISGRAEMVLRQDPQPPARERNLQIIVQQISRITIIVRNLLDFAKRREPKMETIDLAGVVDAVLEFLEGELGRTQVAVVREERRPAWIRGDPALLDQVLVNLVLNALQAMEGTDGSRQLTVRLGPDGGEPGSGSAVLEIEDSGPGIPPDLEATIFEPFVTSKPRGTGLGLVIARRIVEEHLGKLEARRGTQGAIFRITFPLAGPPLERADG